MRISQLIAWGALALPFVFGQLDGGDLPGFNFDFSGAIDAIVSALADAINFVWGELVYVADALSVGLDFTYFTAGEIFQDIVKFFLYIWNNLLKNLVLWLLQELEKLKKWLNEHFGWLLQVLHTLRQMQDTFYKNILRPILNVIIHVRQFLGILRLFHLHFLDGLDRFFAGVQSKLLGNFFKLRQWLNQLATWIEFFFDPVGFLRKSVFLHSLAQAANGTALLFTGRGIDYFSGTDPFDAAITTPTIDSTAIQAELLADLSAQAGPFYELGQLAEDDIAFFLGR
jgi:hypothetical protein